MIRVRRLTCKFFISQFVVILVLLSFPGSMAAQEAESVFHPLDALTSSEIQTVTQILAKTKFVNKETRYATITLKEASKEEVKSWLPKQRFNRKAFVVYRNANESFESTVNLNSKTVESSRRINAEISVLDEEWRAARDAFMRDKRFLDALFANGIAIEDVVCTPNPAGWFPTENFGDRRIFRVPCFSRKHKLHPLIVRPIEAVYGVVDAKTGEVLEVNVRPHVEIGPAPQGYGETLPGQNKGLNPVYLTAPQGPNFQLTGNLNIAWLNWTFHIRADRRAGPILSLIQFQDAGTRREIAYQINVSEMFVPYMDPDSLWANRTFIDVGEFGLGYMMSSLAPGIDCPNTAVFTDLTLPADNGVPYILPRGICIFERVTGDPAWRHYSGSTDKVVGVPQIELVVRAAATVGNYDYILDFVFSPQGNITLRTGATGFDAIRTVASETMESKTAEKDAEFGTLIAPQTVAPNHDHYINYRIDLDIDGNPNTVQLDRIVQMRLPPNSHRRSIWMRKSEVIQTETALDQTNNHQTEYFVRIENPSKKNALKQRPGYWIQSHHQSQSVLTDDDPAQQRADFSRSTFWFSRYNEHELWAAGDYPNQSKGGDGLPKFIAQHEDIEGEDIVLWYTMGFRHVTRPEDFPILPTFWHEVTLRPSSFFVMDPSMSLNPTEPSMEIGSEQ